MLYIPTRSGLRAMEQLSYTWPQVVDELREAWCTRPAPGAVGRLLIAAPTLECVAAEGTHAGDPARFVLGLRERRADAAAEPTNVVGVEPAIAHRKVSRGPARRWPVSWRELALRLVRDHDCVIERGRNHLIVRRDGAPRAYLPVSASDHRSLLNACLQLRRVGIDVSRTD